MTSSSPLNPLSSPLTHVVLGMAVLHVGFITQSPGSQFEVGCRVMVTMPLATGVNAYTRSGPGWVPEPVTPQVLGLVSVAAFWVVFPLTGVLGVIAAGMLHVSFVAAGSGASRVMVTLP